MTGFKDDGDPAWLSDGPEYDVLVARFKEMKADKGFLAWLDILIADHLRPHIQPVPEHWWAYYKAGMNPADAWRSFVRLPVD